MDKKPKITVSVVGDSPLCILGLKVMLASLDINVCSLKNRLDANLRYEATWERITIIDLYFCSEAQVLLEVEKIKSQRSGRFVIFSDTPRKSSDDVIFINRNEKAEEMKRQLYQGILCTWH
ncbi:hypothetical protein ACTVR5_12525 [Serratia marcescens]|uniref:hypothetical protein n=1 Tax=Serratia marcescens TaxID=615 RepID=UPI003FA702C7